MTEYVHVPHQDLLSALTRERDELSQGVSQAAFMLVQMRKENENLRKALKTYGEHSPDCAYADNLRGDCNCGLAEALAVKKCA